MISTLSGRAIFKIVFKSLVQIKSLVAYCLTTYAAITASILAQYTMTRYVEFGLS